LAGALWNEFEAIHKQKWPAVTANGPDASLHAYYDAVLQRDQGALCLSAFKKFVQSHFDRTEIVTRIGF